MPWRTSLAEWAQRAGFERQPRLTDTAHTCKGDEARPFQHRTDLGQLFFATKQGGGLNWQITGSCIERDKRREGRRPPWLAHLKEMLTLRQATQVVFKGRLRGGDGSEVLCTQTEYRLGASRLIRRR